jgi:methylenetetrahydrofolate reductase (NADPH)
MTGEKTGLGKRIDSGKAIVIAEIAPPKGGHAETVRACAKRYAGKVHALGVEDNRDGVRMAALAAASLVASEGVEPILHMVTRDRNRIALISEWLGAQALGVRNLLCTSGTYQTLGQCSQAKNVFDIDSIQLLQAISGLDSNGSVIGEECIEEAERVCLGATAAPYADPPELQIVRLTKKVNAGAKFLVTQPAFDLDRFETWWGEVKRRGLHEKVAILAGIQPLADAERARAYAAERPLPMIPDAILERLSSKIEKNAQHAEGIKIALETVEKLSRLDGLRGFSIRGDGDDKAAVEIIEKAGLETN